MDTHFREAVRAANIDEMRSAVKNGANVNLVDSSNRTALHDAIICGHGIEVIEFLMESGADLDCKDIRGKTPLHFAAEYAEAATAKLLLDNGANPNEEDNTKQTALHWSGIGGDLEAIGHVMSAGVYTNARSTHGNTALHLASANNHTNAVKFFIDNNLA